MFDSSSKLKLLERIAIALERVADALEQHEQVSTTDSGKDDIRPLFDNEVNLLKDFEVAFTHDESSDETHQTDPIEDFLAWFTRPFNTLTNCLPG